MAQRFKAKTLISNSGVFNNELTAPNLVYNTGNQFISGTKTFINPIYFTSGESIYFTAGSGGYIDLRGGNSNSETYVGGVGGYIDLRGGDSEEFNVANGGDGGTIQMRGVPNARAGTINLNAGYVGGGVARGGDINLAGGFAGGRGGDIIMIGGDGLNAGDINTSASAGGGIGGSINTSAGSNGGVSAGGNINTNGGGSPGGNINTSNGGGSIDTRGQGSIGFGIDGTRTTLSGTASQNRTVNLPDSNGTLILDRGGNYIIVQITDDAVVNGNNLLAAYVLAKSTNPNGEVKSASNRLGIVLLPGVYDLGNQSLNLDAQYIDLIGSTNDREQHYIKSNVNGSTINQTANNVRLFNLKIENSITTGDGFYDGNYAYTLGNNFTNTYVKNVKFLANDVNAYSMNLGVSLSGTFIDCEGGIGCFGGGFYSYDTSGGTLSGTFINCKGGDGSFASGNTGGGSLSGIFTDCTAGGLAFGTSITGGGSGIFSGTFINCSAGSYSFGFVEGGSGASFTNTSVFKDCTAGGYSFAYGNVNGGIIAGTMINCTSTGGFSFAYGNARGGTISGTLTNCKSGGFSFASGDIDGGTISGTLMNCTGGDYSFASGFGSNGGTISGTLTNCTGGNYSFASVSDFAFPGTIGTIIGILRDCIGGIRSFNL